MWAVGIEELRSFNRRWVVWGGWGQLPKSADMSLADNSLSESGSSKDTSPLGEEQPPVGVEGAALLQSSVVYSASDELANFDCTSLGSGSKSSSFSSYGQDRQSIFKDLGQLPCPRGGYKQLQVG
jgi:hypothetical protein